MIVTILSGICKGHNLDLSSEKKEFIIGKSDRADIYIPDSSFADGEELVIVNEKNLKLISNQKKTIDYGFKKHHTLNVALGKVFKYSGIDIAILEPGKNPSYFYLKFSKFIFTQTISFITISIILLFFYYYNMNNFTSQVKKVVTSGHWIAFDSKVLYSTLKTDEINKLVDLGIVNTNQIVTAKKDELLILRPDVKIVDTKGRKNNLLNYDATNNRILIASFEDALELLYKLDEFGVASKIVKNKDKNSSYIIQIENDDVLMTVDKNKNFRNYFQKLVQKQEPQVANREEKPDMVKEKRLTTEDLQIGKIIVTTNTAYIEYNNSRYGIGNFFPDVGYLKDIQNDRLIFENTQGQDLIVHIQ